MNNGSSRSHSECKCETNVNVWVRVWMRVSMWVWVRIACGNLDIYCIFGKGRGRGGPPIGAFPLHNDESECICLQHMQQLPTYHPLLPHPPTHSHCSSPFWQSPLLLSISAEHFTQLTRFCFCLFWCHQPNGSANGSGQGRGWRRGVGGRHCMPFAGDGSVDFLAGI